MLEATRRYRESEDLVGRFIRECCLVGPDLKVQSSALYDAFRFWYAREISRKGEYSNKRFSDIMAKKNYEKKKLSAMFWLGLDLTAEFRREMGEAGESHLPGF